MLTKHFYRILVTTFFISLHQVYAWNRHNSSPVRFLVEMRRPLSLHSILPWRQGAAAGPFRRLWRHSISVSCSSRPPKLCSHWRLSHKARKRYQVDGSQKATWHLCWRKAVPQQPIKEGLRKQRTNQTYCGVICSVIKGPITPADRSGNGYMTNFIDYKSHYCRACLAKTKDQAAKKFEHFLTWFERRLWLLRSSLANRWGPWISQRWPLLPKGGRCKAADRAWKPSLQWQGGAHASDDSQHGPLDDFCRFAPRETSYSMWITPSTEAQAEATTAGSLSSNCLQESRHHCLAL